jgi:hypothetical protein
MLKEFECRDCKKDTFRDEYYMVHNHLWDACVNEKCMLCIACLETRFGRELNSDDFTTAPINYRFPKSKLLEDRMKKINE